MTIYIQPAGLQQCVFLDSGNKYIFFLFWEKEL